MKKETLSLEHEKKLSELLENIDVALSEFSFANLYLFRDKHDYKLINDNENLFLSGITYDGKTFVMPLSDLSDDNNADYFDKLLKLSVDYDMIYPIPEKWINKFSDDNFIVSYTDDDSDYLYEIDDLAFYPGRKLHGKRNLVSQFLRNYKVEILPLNSENKHLAAEILDKWQNEVGEDKKQTDFIPCAEALQNIKELNQTGQIFLIDGAPKGFVMGEEYGTKYCVIHFAKADSAIKGLYQYMFSIFAQSNKERECSFINLEQDLGKEGLRAMKKSYYPTSMLVKYRISMK